jgi:hypothetical protein
MDRRRGAESVLSGDLDNGPSLKGNFACQEFIENDANGILVRSRGECLAGYQLR